MFPEVSSGMIETRHIVTPIRSFCNRAKFYEANIEAIDLENKQILITHAVGKETDPRTTADSTSTSVSMI